jgi:hypothetical protein
MLAGRPIGRPIYVRRQREQPKAFANFLLRHLEQLLAFFVPLPIT